MKPLFDVEGRVLLRELATCRHPLFVFDYDGTLAPLVDRPDSARIPPAVMRRLRLLARQFPLGVVSGRALDDLQLRLPPEVTFAVGNRGLEGLDCPADEWARRLDPLRERLAGERPALARAGIGIEDKQYSIALHYRLAPSEALARRQIDALLDAPEPGITAERGHCVVNFTASGAPHKGEMLRRMAMISAAAGGLYVGDDTSDEWAFRAAPPGWLTVRVGRGDDCSGARFYLDSQSHVPVLLQELVEAIRWRRGPPAGDAGPAQPRS